MISGLLFVGLLVAFLEPLGESGIESGMIGAGVLAGRPRMRRSASPVNRARSLACLFSFPVPASG